MILGGIIGVLVPYGAVITTLVSILGCVIFFTRPISNIKKSLEPIDFNKESIDFTKLDTIAIKDKDLMYLVDKYRMFADVVEKHVDSINTEVYKSTHDELTKCYNRAKLKQMEGLYYHKYNLFVIFIDVNNLKKMNDIFGHEAGDRLLRTAAEKLKFWEDYGDVYRLGGDEFMVIIPDKGKRECEKLLNGWYPTVGVLNRPTDGFQCRLAIGTAFGGMYSDINLLQKKADEKMYKHKESIKSKLGEEMR